MHSVPELEAVYGCILALHAVVPNLEVVPPMDRMMELWTQGNISTFEYISHLNSAAGRTRNNLDMYPIFPWLVTNMESDNLSFVRPSSFLLCFYSYFECSSFAEVNFCMVCRFCQRLRVVS